MPPKPPGIRELMDDPIYRAYMKQVPPRHHANTNGKPWQVWVETREHKWRTGEFTSYREVWPVFLKQFRNPDAISDVTITSRRVFYAPPGEWYRVKVRCNPTLKHPKGYRIEERWRQIFFWDIGLNWCGRCRRPVYWMPLFANHHALRRLPAISDEDNYRCLICGIRWCATPPIELMEK